MKNGFVMLTIFDDGQVFYRSTASNGFANLGDEDYSEKVSRYLDRIIDAASQLPGAIEKAQEAA